VKNFYPVALVSSVLVLSACSTLENEKIDYRGTTKIPTLDVPPDMTQLSKETRYTVVGGAVSAGGIKAAGSAKESVAVSATGDFKIERAGAQRWIVTGQSPEKLWEPIKRFWIENGLLVAIEDSRLGYMETAWTENRATIPQGFIRSTIGKLFDSMYSANARDQYRTRLERNATGGTEIYISHRGLEEVGSGSSPAWQRRASDSELEIEFMRRLALKLGAGIEQANAIAASADQKSGTTVTSINGQPAIALQEDFDRAWRRVGLALDRTGFTVEDRDRKQGIYFVRYVPAVAEGGEQGFFSKLFSSDSKNTEAAKLQIVVRGEDKASTITVLNSSGAPVVLENAQRIVKVLAEELK
jgi:outer membrane protein assembly factor BamC